MHNWFKRHGKIPRLEANNRVLSNQLVCITTLSRQSFHIGKQIIAKLENRRGCLPPSISRPQHCRDGKWLFLWLVRENVKVWPFPKQTTKLLDNPKKANDIALLAEHKNFTFLIHLFAINAFPRLFFYLRCRVVYPYFAHNTTMETLSIPLE